MSNIDYKKKYFKLKDLVAKSLLTIDRMSELSGGSDNTENAAQQFGSKVEEIKENLSNYNLALNAKMSESKENFNKEVDDQISQVIGVLERTANSTIDLIDKLNTQSASVVDQISKQFSEQVSEKLKNVNDKLTDLNSVLTTEAPKGTMVAQGGSKKYTTLQFGGATKDCGCGKDEKCHHEVDEKGCGHDHANEPAASRQRGGFREGQRRLTRAQIEKLRAERNTSRSSPPSLTLPESDPTAAAVDPTAAVRPVEEVGDDVGPTAIRAGEEAGDAVRPVEEEGEANAVGDEANAVGPTADAAEEEGDAAADPTAEDANAVVLGDGEEEVFGDEVLGVDGDTIKRLTDERNRLEAERNECQANLQNVRQLLRRTRGVLSAERRQREQQNQGREQGRGQGRGRNQDQVQRNNNNRQNSTVGGRRVSLKFYN